MAKPSAHPEFKGLSEEWKKRLSESGFEDIEEFRNGTWQLKKSGTQGRFERSAPIVREAKAKYFDIIGQKIIETTFANDQERQILTYYFEGFTQAEIKRKLGLHRTTVYKKLIKWLKRWKLR